MRRYGHYYALLLVALLLPYLLPNRYAMHLLIYIFMYGALALAWDLIGGIGGQLSLGHAAFFGIGAYTGVLLMVDYGIPPLLSLGVALILSVVAAVVIGLPAFRLHGVFFVMTTIAFSEMFRVSLLNFESLTHGARGLNVPFMEANALFLQFDGRRQWYYLFLALLVLVAVIHATISRSRIGYGLRALREDELAARAYGIRTEMVKLVAFVISATITAAVGLLSGFYIGYIDPYSVAGLPLSIKMAVMAIVGGRDSTVGGLIGAALIIALEEVTNAWFGQFAGLNVFLYGVLIIAVVLAAPRGVVPLFSMWLQRVARTSPGATHRNIVVRSQQPATEGETDPRVVNEP